ncbi:hypothetical protein K2X89_09010 [Myxococcota bacterium]|nr:hypothetical protein [Myxococcota bacterium]
MSIGCHSSRPARSFFHALLGLVAACILGLPVSPVLGTTAWAQPAVRTAGPGAGSIGGPVARGAGVLGVAETEALVRRVDFEGMPEDDAARIGPAGVARLVEMLGDPAERPHQARILLALGSAGGAFALEAIRGWLDALPGEGELDRATFRAWQNLPFALGRLAHREPRAVAELVARFEAEPPGFSFRHFQGERLRQLEQRAALTALAETRRPDAARALEALARRPHSPAIADHLRAVRAEMQAAMQAEAGGPIGTPAGAPTDTSIGTGAGGAAGAEP